MSYMKDAAIDAHNYATLCDTLTVFELVTRLEDWAVTNLIGGRSQVYPEREIIIAALRFAVIREASVGTVSVKTETQDGYPYVDALKLNDKPSHGWLVYDLIPKETP
jgi:hypothetical protein